MGFPGGPSIGQLIGGIGGAILGSIIPGVGTIVGFTVGLGIGTFIDPPRIEEPEASPFAFQDIQFNTFARNLPVPIIYGVNRVGGNVIWIGNTRTEIREHEPEGGGGKGLPSVPDPPTIQETIYHADFILGLSEGEIEGVSKTWIDDDDISDREGLNFTVFKGTSSQATQAEMITALGSDALPFRHLAHTLFTGELGNINRIPIVSQLVVGIEGGIDPATTLVFSIGGVNRMIGVTCFEDKQKICIGHTIQNGAIYRTTDGSLTKWETVYVGGTTGLLTEKMIGTHPGVSGRAYCFAGGFPVDRFGAVRTEDYGATWGNSTSTPGEIDSVKGVENNSSEVVMGVEFPTGIAKSFDGGLTYTMQQSIDEIGGFPALLQFPGTDVWCAATAGGATYRSTDNGNSWTFVQENGNLVNEGIAIDADTGFINRSDAIKKTTDRGLTWVDVLPNNDFGGGQSITHNRETKIIFRLARVSTKCKQFVSVDEGETWTCQRSETPETRQHFNTAFNMCWAGFLASVQCEKFAIPTSCGNPSLIVHDFLSNERYGLGIASATLDQQSFVNAANYCSGPVEINSGTTESRFCLDIVLDRGKPAPDHLRDMLSTFRGFLTWSQGIVRLQIEKAEDVAQSFDQGNIVPDSFKWRKQSYRDRPNVVRVEYIDPGPDDDYRLDFQSAYDDWDIDQSGERRERIFRLIGIKRASQARRMATFFLDQAIHITNAAAFRVGIGALEAEAGDVIEVTHEVPNWTRKKFRILRIEEFDDDELTLEVLEYNASIYGDIGAETAGADRSVAFDPLAVPYHPGRLTAYQRTDNDIELALTRVATNDLTTTQRFFLKRGSAEFEAIGQGLPFTPTAFIDVDIQG